MTESFIWVKHSRPAGDLLAAMAGLKRLSEDLSKRVIIAQRLGMKGIGYKGASHPFIDEQGDEITMNKYMFDMLRPLIISQDYIEDFIVYEGQEVEIDLDKAIMETYTNQPLGSLNRWIFHVYPQMSCDLSQKWITASTTECISGTKNGEPFWYQGEKAGNHNAILLNFTDRYRNYLSDYFFLKKYEKYLFFTGMPMEHDRFCKQWNLDIPLLRISGFDELAAAIKSCRFFMSNASVCFQIAEALKVPRMLEICPMMPNVIPIGENAFDYYHQSEAEYLFEKLYNLDKT